MSRSANAERWAVTPRFPEEFPAPWAGEWGEDEFGLWMVLRYREARQQFRWIEPGTFEMGSPPHEAERYDDEVQHEVTLTRGFWLADTACTQALWVAVMDENPSFFKDDPNHPVENVSWDDVQAFIARLNGAVDDLNARLPTEAEWEYACRAGARESLPFSFGATITPDQVNYDGNHPCAGGAKGLYRERTVPVKSLPPNAWGLYEMHGNVWEWCADRYGAYRSGPVVDPVGPSEGARRVLRGGSWVRSAGHARSASRSYDDPAPRYGIYGFRLALGPVHPPGR